MKVFMVLMVSLFLLPSCVRQLSSDVYPTYQAGEAAYTLGGDIISARRVVVQNGDEGNGAGVVAGGVVGGLAGNAIGRGGFWPTAAGVVAGAFTGAAIENSASRQWAMEYVVSLDNGNLVTVIQGDCPAYGIGQHVFVIFSRTGQSRLIPQP